MTPGTVFISHRAEYRGLVIELKKAIEATSRGQISVWLSEDIPSGEAWRGGILSALRNAENLFFVYGAPYEDWSWCFFEAGFFAGISAAEKQFRRTYCIAPPNTLLPGPLSNLEMVTHRGPLIAVLMDIYERNGVDFDPAQLSETITLTTKGLFDKRDEFMSYSRVYFEAIDAEFSEGSNLPASSVLTGDRVLLTQLFGIGKDRVRWSEINEAAANWTGEDRLLFTRWIEEVRNLILGARKHRVISPQISLITPGGPRFRFLHYQSRVQADGLYLCEFLVLNDTPRSSPEPAIPISLLELAPVSRTKIFLASSSELEADRKDFEIFIYRKTKEWIGRGTFIDLIVWEDFLDAMSKTRSQDEYNTAIRTCDIFIALFWTKVGVYTYEEFTTAIGQFKSSNNKPLIYTYFKDSKISTAQLNRDELNSLWKFQDRLKELGHFYSTYEDMNALKYNFNRQLDKLVESKFITFNDGPQKIVD